MAIIGVHTLVYTSEAAEVRAVLRDVFGWKHVDAGDGWLIFAMPPSEMGVHPEEAPRGASGHHQISLMCDDIHATIRDLHGKPGVEIVGEPADLGWGIVVMLRLPGGLSMQLYQPRHKVAIATKKPSKSATRQSASRGTRRRVRQAGPRRRAPRSSRGTKARRGRR